MGSRLIEVDLTKEGVYLLPVNGDPVRVCSTKDEVHFKAFLDAYQDTQEQSQVWINFVGGDYVDRSQ